jgi:hypothetical protein
MPLLSQKIRASDPAGLRPGYVLNRLQVSWQKGISPSGPRAGQCSRRIPARTEFPCSSVCRLSNSACRAVVIDGHAGIVAWPIRHAEQGSVEPLFVSLSAEPALGMQSTNASRPSGCRSTAPALCAKPQGNPASRNSHAKASARLRSCR